MMYCMYKGDEKGKKTPHPHQKNVLAGKGGFNGRFGAVAATTMMMRSVDEE